MQDISGRSTPVTRPSPDVAAREAETLAAQVASLQARADAYDDAVRALAEVRGGPLSTTIGYLIRARFLVPADPPPTTTEIAENWPAGGAS